MAAARKKVSRDELKKDEVAEAIETFVEQVRGNAYRITVVVTVAVILIVGVVVLTQARERARMRTTQIFLDTHELLSAITIQQDEQEKQRLIQEQVNELEAFIADEGASENGRRALYLLGNLYYRLGQQTEAENTFRRFLELAPSGLDEARGRIALGNVLEERYHAGEETALLDEAGKQYEEATQEAPDFSYAQGQALLDLARVYELTNRLPEATEIYERVIQEFPAPRDTFHAEVEPDAEPVDAATVATGNVLVDAVMNQLNQDVDPLSFEAVARQRIADLQATTGLLPPEDGLTKRLPFEAPSRPVAEDEPATVTATTPPAAPAASTSPTAEPATDAEQDTTSLGGDLNTEQAVETIAPEETAVDAEAGVDLIDSDETTPSPAADAEGDQPETAAPDANPPATDADSPTTP